MALGHTNMTSIVLVPQTRARLPQCPHPVVITAPSSTSRNEEFSHPSPSQRVDISKFGPYPIVRTSVGLGLVSKMISLVKIRIQDEPIKTQERGIKRLEKGCDWDLGSTPSASEWKMNGEDIWQD